MMYFYPRYIHSYSSHHGIIYSNSSQLLTKNNLLLPLVNETDLEGLAHILLRNNDSASIISNAVDHGKSPDLGSVPSNGVVHGVVLDETLSIRSPLLLKPILLQEIIQRLPLSTAVRQPSRLSHQATKNMVLVWSIRPIQDTLLRGSLDSAGGGLVDVDVGDTGFVDVLLDGEGDGGKVDGFALEPADALEGEDSVGWVGEGLGLVVLLAGACVWKGGREGRERAMM